jgi:hypothetical protein
LWRLPAGVAAENTIPRFQTMTSPAFPPQAVFVKPLRQACGKLKAACGKSFHVQHAAQG